MPGYAVLDSLKVHPDYRRRGIARRLTDRRLERATELGGDEVVIVAYIQAGNTASLANAPVGHPGRRSAGRLPRCRSAGARPGRRPG
jgi:GNAT superfamily N-acetyltransferase